MAGAAMKNRLRFDFAPLLSFRGSAEPRARNPWTPASGKWIPGSPPAAPPRNGGELCFFFAQSHLDLSNPLKTHVFGNENSGRKQRVTAAEQRQNSGIITFFTTFQRPFCNKQRVVRLTLLGQDEGSGIRRSIFCDYRYMIKICAFKRARPKISRGSARRQRL